MRHAASIICAILIGSWAAAARGQESAPEPPEPAGKRIEDDAPARRSHDLVKLLDVGPGFFDGVDDGQPLDDPQREKLLKLLYRLRRLGPAGLEKFKGRPDAVAAIHGDPGKFRGTVFDLSGVTTYAVREELDAQQREKFQVDAWYRCRMMTFLARDVTVYTLSVPSQWPLGKPIREQCHTRAVFIKELPETGDRAPRGGRPWIGVREPLLFVAPRIEWYPANLLGHLRMDCGLFDGVRDHRPLEERECFYQLLAAVRRADKGQIERTAQEQLASRTDLLERMANNPHQLAKDRAAAQRALQRARENCDDVVPLFNDPAGQRGKLFALVGEALRAIEIQVNDPDVVDRFGIDHYYEIEIVTPDSQNNPVVFCVAELPAGMPLGESIHQGVRIAGYFLKSWAFDSQKTAAGGSPGERRQQLAPLLVAETVHVLETPGASGAQSMTLAGLLAVAIVVGAAVLWYLQRGDRKALAAAGRGADSLPPQIALEAPQDAADDDTSGEL